MLKKQTVAVLLLICLFFGTIMPVDAYTCTPLEDFTYTVQQTDKTVLLTQYTGKSSDVTVPGSYTLEGAEYGVVLDSTSVFFGNTNLRSVTLQRGIALKDNSMSRLFAKCSNLKSVDLGSVDSASVTDMSYLFYDCEKLENLDLSGLETGAVTTMKAMFSGCTALRDLAGYRVWDTGSLTQMNYMFNKTFSLKTVDLRRWDLSNIVNSGWCFQNCAAKTILLPDNLSVISAGFLNHAAYYTGSDFEIPVGVQKIGFAHTLYNFGTADLAKFVVADGNPHYKTVDGILYSADGTQMLAIPKGKKFPDGVYEIPEGVTFLGELSFSRNYHVSKVILPDSYVLRFVNLNDPDYILVDDTGNLNAGSNLNIAIYSYTGIREYAVKPSNSRYASMEGVIYTKDMQAVVAVPSRFSGKLQIPDGVTRWERGAMWCAGESADQLMSDCTGVIIPASMTDISPDQMDKLNRLESRYSHFKIQVSPDNPVYYVGKNGQLIQKPLIADMEIQLETDTVIYNGLEQMPGITISHEGELLQEGKDYTLEYENNVDAGTGWIRITALGLHTGSALCSFSIEPAIPSYTVPTDIKAEYGNVLKDVMLPDGFSWVNPEQELIKTGVLQFSAIYQPGDKNFTDVENISISVEISPKVLKAPEIRTPVYNSWFGEPVTPPVRVLDGEKIVNQEEYIVHYSKNEWFGIGTLQLEDRPGGDYTISGSDTFWILPDPVFVIAAITLLWLLTTGRKLRKTGGQLSTQPKNR